MACCFTGNKDSETVYKPDPGVSASCPPGASEDPTLPVGLPGGRVPGVAGETPSVRRRLRLCTWLPALQPGGVGVAGLGHLPDTHLHRHAGLDSGLTWSRLVQLQTRVQLCWVFLPSISSVLLTGDRGHVVLTVEDLRRARRNV